MLAQVPRPCVCLPQLTNSSASPLNSGARLGKYAPFCVMSRIREFVLSPEYAHARSEQGVMEGLGWPLPEEKFGPTVWKLLQTDDWLRGAGLVGFSDDHSKAPSAPLLACCTSHLSHPRPSIVRPQLPHFYRNANYHTLHDPQPATDSNRAPPPLFLSHLSLCFCPPIPPLQCSPSCPSLPRSSSFTLVCYSLTLR